MFKAFDKHGRTRLRYEIQAHLGGCLGEIDMVARRRLAGRTEQFTCPVCLFKGGFSTRWGTTGRRVYSVCPGCGGLERHRLQALVLDILAERHDLTTMSCLHIAPEAMVGSKLRSLVSNYVTGDISANGVDLAIDLTNTGQPTESYDLVFASHVLEHISDDGAALSEVVRILRPGGFAILPVPIDGPATVEFPGPFHSEAEHVRAPGPDYFDRYRAAFSKVDIFTSAHVDEKYQTFVYEDRSRFPTLLFPYRLPSAGARHLEFVPVAYK